MVKKFQRRIENFICEKCGQNVKGDGYTNHCPHCLWSKHVDINPGDRINNCQGLMEPINVYFKSQEWYLNHKCQKCGEIKVIKLRKNDNLEVISDILDNQIKNN